MIVSSKQQPSKNASYLRKVFMNLSIMKLVSFSLFLLCFIVFLSLNSAEKLKRVCYIISGNSNQTIIQPKDMQWNLCTHVIYCFASLNKGIVAPDPMFVDYVLAMNASRPANVKALFSIGGGFEFARNQTFVEKFIDSVIEFCNKYRLDGIDLDWEFPSYTYDKDTFTRLLLSMRKRFDLELFNSGKEILLSVALTPILYIVDQSYDMDVISKSVSFVNLMTYDFHSPNTLIYTNFNSPLFPTKYDLWYFKYFNVDYSVRLMLNKGLPRDKIVVGIPFYGYLYYLTNPNYNSVFSLTNGTQESITYSRICRLNARGEPSKDVRRVFDSEAKVPYIYSGSKWITFDDIQSVTIKSQWIVDKKLGGAMTFALNYDDIGNECGAGAFALQQTITDVLL